MSPSREDYSRGKRRLKTWSPKARLRARKSLQDRELHELRPYNGIATSLLDHITEKNLEAILIYEDGKDRWFADVVLKKTPIGVPNVFGTPVNDPLPSRVEAEKSGFTMLVMIWEQILTHTVVSRDTPKTDGRIFLLYAMEFTIDGQTIDTMAGLVDQVSEAVGIEFEDDPIERLEKALKPVAGEEDLTAEAWNAASDTQREAIHFAMAMCLLQGHFRYPLRRQQSSND